MTPPAKDNQNESIESMLRELLSRQQEVPKTWMELVYRTSMTLGVPTVILGVLLFIAYQTFPPFVNANIETQKSLTTNLDKQTANIEAQTKSLQAQTQNLEAQTSAIQEVQSAVVEIVETERQAQTAMLNIERDHTQIKEDHVQQMTTQKAMVDTLEAISNKLNQ